MGFTFKQFHVEHDLCAMKVGTDGILLGSWAPVKSGQRVLDIGTGTGLIALMLAQRSVQSQIQAIDLDSGAVQQARQNVAASPWPERIQVEQCRLQDYKAGPFDLIVSNPPYFPHGQEFDCQARKQARHTGSLSLAELAESISRLLAAHGQAALVLPVSQHPQLEAEMSRAGLLLQHHCEVFSKSGKKALRSLLLFGKEPVEPSRSSLYIHDETGAYSADYVALTKDFYLKM